VHTIGVALYLQRRMIAIDTGASHVNHPDGTGFLMSNPHAGYVTVPLCHSGTGLPAHFLRIKALYYLIIHETRR
jgi:hypothetical protein